MDNGKKYKKKVIDDFEISAIIGMWRNGATDEEIIGATGWPIQSIKKIISDYKNKLKQQNTDNGNN